MNKSRKKSYLISAATLALIFLLLLLVFRDALPDILANLRAVPLWGILLLLFMGFAYEGMEAAVALVLLRRKKRDVRYLDGLNTTFLAVFGNIATMGACTLPMQSFYLYRRGLDAGGALGIMASEYVLHKISVLLYATLALLLGGTWLRESASSIARYIRIGYGIGALIVLFLTLLYTWDKVIGLAGRLLRKLPQTPKWDARRTQWLAGLYPAQHRGAQGFARAVGAAHGRRRQHDGALRALRHPLSCTAPCRLHGAYVLADAAACFADAAHHERTAERRGRGADGIRLSAPFFAVGGDCRGIVGAGALPCCDIFFPLSPEPDHVRARGEALPQGI